MKLNHFAKISDVQIRTDLLCDVTYVILKRRITASLLRGVTASYGVFVAEVNREEGKLVVLTLSESYARVEVVVDDRVREVLEDRLIDCRRRWKVVG